MVNHKNENLEEKFKHLFEEISNETFLNKRAIGGEVPFFISTFNPKNQNKVNKYIESLKKKLEVNGISVININLYDLTMEILKDRNIFDKLLVMEPEMTKSKFLNQIQSLVDEQTKITPRIKLLLDEQNYQVIFLTGIGLVYPYIRSVKIFNCLSSIIKTKPLVMFFPGDYDGTKLLLFGMIKEPYYRAFNIDIIKLKKET